MLLVRRRWFPEKKFLLFCTTGDAQWDAYFKESILPKVQDAAVLADCSEPDRWPKRGAPLEARILRAFNRDARKGPSAIIFKPYFEHEKIYFGEAFDAYMQGSDHQLGKNEARLFELVEKQRERMALYF